MTKLITYCLMTIVYLLVGSVATQSIAVMKPLFAPDSLAPSPLGAPVLLKLNDTYLLYSYPTPPFIDATGHIMVPVGIMGQLLGAEVSYDLEGKVATLTRLGRSLYLSVGSDEAYLDDRPVELGVAPRLLDKDVLVVPIRVLLESFDIAFTWDDATRTLALHGTAILQDGNITSTFANRLPEGYTDTEAFIPQDIALRETAEEGISSSTELTLTLRSTTETNGVSGEPVLFLMAKYAQDGPVVISGTDTYISADTGNRATGLCEKVGTEFRCRVKYDQPGKLAYIIARVMIPDG